MDNIPDAMNILPQGAGSRLDADTLRKKRPEDFAKAEGDTDIPFSVSTLTATTVATTNETLAGYIQGTEISAPGAGAVNTGRLYFRDNGAGKTQLVVIFNTGAVQVIATQP